MRIISLMLTLCLFDVYAYGVNNSKDISDNYDSEAYKLPVDNDSIQSEATVDSVQKSLSFWQKFQNYFKDSNKTKKDKKFDISFIGGPFYSTDAKFGIGVVGAGLYKMDRTDTITKPSNISLFANVSSVGFYLVGIKGVNIFPEDRFRLNYSLTLYSFPSYFWGIGYKNGNNDDNKTKMKRLQTQVKVNFLARIAKNFYAGPILIWNYIKGDSIDRPELLEGQNLINRNYGAGLLISYDSRDILTNASHGIYAYIEQIFRPKWLGNDYAFSTTNLHFSYYHPLWKGAVIATQALSSFNIGNPSWAMMAKIGDSNSMRGYYEGRYRDNSKIEAQIELRQHIWRRNGIVVWVGAGTIFHNKLNAGDILPNYGFGYRWEFKKKMNVRLDLGFGKSGQYGFIFNINEAF